MKQKKFEDMLDGFREWHCRDHRTMLASRFELGDLILNAIILTGLERDDIIRRIIKEFGEQARSKSTYSRACRFATIYNANQRAVLIDKCVPINRIDKLASAKYTDADRTQKIAYIKHGEIKNWSSIRGISEEKHLKETKVLRHGIAHTCDVIAIQIRNMGQFQRDLMYDGLQALVSQVKPQETLVEGLNKAVDICNKRGAKLKRFRI